ncbi:MAG: hypothetical protein H5T99_01645, partial [Moorella sp. (in: Bacteria)]|nr:hypothetical protein [Moorella sp. (in: firmicutes)]
TLQKGSEAAQPYTSGTPVSEEGQYTLTVTARDAAGNEAQTVVHFTIGGTAAGSPGGATGGGDTTASGGGKEDTGINASNVTDIVSDPNSSENNVAEAVGNASDSLINTAERMETTSDAEKVVDAAAGIAGAITQATDRVESEDAAAKVASSAVKVTEALAKAASRVTSDAARQKLIESAVVSLDAVENAALKIASAEKAAAAAIAQAAALRNIKHIIQVTADTKAVVGIMTKTASVLDSNARLIARAAGPEEAAAVAKEIIDGVAALTKAATAGAITDYGVRQAAKKVQEKVVHVVEKAIEKAGTERIATDEVVVEGAKARISIEAERL